MRQPTFSAAVECLVCKGASKFLPPAIIWCWADDQFEDQFLLSHKESHPFQRTSLLRTMKDNPSHMITIQLLFPLFQTEYLADEGAFYIVSPLDIIVTKQRDKDDHIEWLLANNRFEVSSCEANQQEGFDSALQILNCSPNSYMLIRLG